MPIVEELSLEIASRTLQTLVGGPASLKAVFALPSAMRLQVGAMVSRACHPDNLCLAVLHIETITRHDIIYRFPEYRARLAVCRRSRTVSGLWFDDQVVLPPLM